MSQQSRFTSPETIRLDSIRYDAASAPTEPVISPLPEHAWRRDMVEYFRTHDVHGKPLVKRADAITDARAKNRYDSANAWRGEEWLDAHPWKPGAV
jgi:hypothetical protein